MPRPGRTCAREPLSEARRGGQPHCHVGGDSPWHLPSPQRCHRGGRLPKKADSRQVNGRGQQLVRLPGQYRGACRQRRRLAPLKGIACGAVQSAANVQQLCRQTSGMHRIPCCSQATRIACKGQLGWVLLEGRNVRVQAAKLRSYVVIPEHCVLSAPCLIQQPVTGRRTLGERAEVDWRYVPRPAWLCNPPVVCGRRVAVHTCCPNSRQ